MPPFAPSDRVVILGAGATLGASFAGDATVRPPLNADFFTQLQRMRGKHSGLVKRVVEDVVGLFGPNFTLTLEDYFSQLESMIDATRFTPKGVAKLTGADLRARRDRLMAALSAVSKPRRTRRFAPATAACDISVLSSSSTRATQ